MKPQKTNCKILIVDSSLLVVERLFGLLQEICEDHVITKTYNFAEALQKLKNEKYDIVVLDTQLPDKNGFELLLFIKQNFPGTKTIMLTNQSSDFYRNKCKKIGTDYFIDKSDEFEKIVGIIKDYSVGYEMN